MFCYFRGNMLLVGAVGSHLTTLCQLALHVADVQTLKIDTSKQSNFFDGLRSAIRLTGSEGKILTLVFTVSVLLCVLYLIFVYLFPLLILVVIECSYVVLAAVVVIWTAVFCRDLNIHVTLCFFGNIVFEFETLQI